jgi:glycosyltransferase involved in cell wall biosynthesis
MNIAIFHDFIVGRGGGERVVNLFSNFFPSKIFTSFYLPTYTYEEFKRKEIFYCSFPLNKSIIKLREARILKSFIFFDKQIKNIAKIINKNFDVSLFSGFYSIYASKFIKMPKFYYIQAEPLEFALKRAENKNPIYQKIYKVFVYKNEKTSLLKMDKIIANSNYTKNMYEKFLEKKVNEVIYPPVDTKSFRYKKNEEFFLFVGRLYKHKRVDIVTKAFSKIPNEKLVVVGDGPLRSYVEKMSKKYNNIDFKGRVSDNVLKDLYSRCKAVIYITEKEPFGLVPVEANASGKPAIVSNEGGVKETIIPEKTGIIIKEPYLENLVKVIMNFDHFKFKPSECIKNSKRFDITVFIKKWKKVLENI